MESITDYHEEKEGDEAKMLEAMSEIKAMEKRLDTIKAEENERLAKVTIDKAHVDLIAEHMDIDKAAAEKALRQKDGDCVAALQHLVHMPPT